MDDRELEEVLGRYRPRGPSSDLRQSVLAGRPGRVWPWAVAAAALLAMTIGFSSAAERLRPAAIAPPQPVLQAWVDAQPMDKAEIEWSLERLALITAVQQRDSPPAPEVEPWR
jgi:hypothetical protein